MRVYVAGPYTANHPREVLANVNRAIDIGMELMKKGHAVYVPHWTHYMHLRPHCTFEYEDYVRNDLEWIKVCEGFFLIKDSPGALIELKLARKLGLKIFYNLEEVPDEKL